jgi:glycosyltransferase involved in cell wall biosynthesis
MKILQLVTKRQYRGAEVFAANLSSELIGFGHEIIFAGLYRNDSDVLEVEGAENVDLCLSKSGNFSFELVRAIAKLITYQKPDVVQCNGSDTLKYMISASYFTSKIPITYRNISTISEWIDSPLKLRIYKLLFKKVDYVTSVGSESIKDLITTLNYPEEQTSVIRRGIPLKEVNPPFSNDLRKELNLKESDKVVMHIGNFSPEKNHEFLLDIFSKIKEEESHVKLICVGDGITFKGVKQQIKNQNLEDTVFLLGFRKDIPELLAQADCFALASKIEGVPGVILEAASQRIPSVATNVGGVPEVLVNGETGYIIDNFNKNEFKERLISLVTNFELNKEMGENAYNLVQEEFNPLNNARKFEKLYAQLTNSSLVEKNQLRILQIIQKKQFRGAEIFASQLANHLQNSEHTVKVVSIYDGVARLPFSGEVESLNRRKLSRAFDPYGWQKLSGIVKNFKPDIVQANAADTLKYAVLSKLVFRWKAPLVYRNASTSSFYIKNYFSKMINSFLLKKIDLIVSVSHASLKDLNSLFPFTINKSVVIPVGVEEEHASFQPAVANPYANPEKINLLHIGSFTREKNHQGLIRIFKRILSRDANYHLNLIGSGPLISEIKMLVKDLDLTKNVEFLGEIENPQNHIKFSKFLLLPSFIEGLPAVILEAMYQETPVVAYDVGGVSEVIKNNKTGKLIKFNDEIGFCEAILHLDRDSDLRRKIVGEGKKMVLEKYMNFRIKNLFEATYRKLCL